MRIGRSFQGLAKRWLGVSAATGVTDLAPFVLPVLQVGMDACDGGGMNAVSCAPSTPGAISGLLQMTSSRGIAVYGVRVETNAVGSTIPLRMSVRSEPVTPTGGSFPVNSLAPLRDTVAVCTAEPVIAGAIAVPLAGGLSIEVVEWARPIVVPSEHTLLLQGPTNTLNQLAVFFEEGL